MTHIDTADFFRTADHWFLPVKGLRSRLAAFMTAVSGVAAMMAGTASASHAGQRSRQASSADDVTRRFQQVVLPHLDSAYNFARFLARDTDAAQDIVQDAFLRAFKSFDGFRGGDPRAWLFSIVRNCYHAWLLQRRRRSTMEVPLATDADDTELGFATPEIASDEDSVETVMIRDAETKQVRQVIDGLPDAMREVLVLRELEDMSYRQIADVIDAPIGTVMSRLARARKDFGEAWLACEKSGVAE